MVRKFFKSNHFTIFLSIILALALWLFVVGDTLFQVSPQRKVLKKVPLLYINLEENLAVTGLDNTETITVVLEGLPERLRDVKSDDLIAFIDLNEKGPGNYAADVKVNPPEGLSVVSFLPSTADITIIKKY